MFPCRKGGVRISGGFCLLLAWFGVANGWKLLGLVLGAAAVHELGHAAVLAALGARIRALRLGVLGAELVADRSGLSYGGELLAVLAGPAANFLLALALAADHPAAAGASLVLGGFNLLPVGPLDGGQAVRILCWWHLGPERGERAAAAVSLLFGMALAGAAALVMLRCGGSLWLLPPALAAAAAAGRAAVSLLPGKKEKIGLAFSMFL